MEASNVVDLNSRRRERILYISDDSDVIEIVDGTATSTASTRPLKKDHTVDKLVASYDEDDSPTGWGSEYNAETANDWIRELIKKHNVGSVVVWVPGNPGSVHIPASVWMDEMNFEVDPEEMPDEMWPAGKEARFMPPILTFTAAQDTVPPNEHEIEIKLAMRKWAMAHPGFVYAEDNTEILHKSSRTPVIRLTPRGIEVKWDLRPTGAHKNHIKPLYVTPKELKNVVPPKDLKSTLDLA